MAAPWVPRHSGTNLHAPRSSNWGKSIDDAAEDVDATWSSPRARRSSASAAAPVRNPGASRVAFGSRHAGDQHSTTDKPPEWSVFASPEASPPAGMVFDVVAGWWDYQRLMRGSPAERRALEAGHPARTHQSWIEVWGRINRGGNAALDLVVSLVDAAPGGDDVVAVVGTGPLEDLVRKHGNSLADEIAHVACGNARFAQALTSVMARGVLTVHAARRLSPWVP